MILMESIKKSFETNVVLEDINFTVKKGERVALIGPGGCGKTTILKILLGLVSPDQGKAHLFGESLPSLGDHQLSKLLKNVGMAFQQGGLFDFMTVRENMLFAMENMINLSSQEMEDRIVELLEAVKLGRTGDMFPYELSGGMKRRIGIIRALCTDPTIAIFDEPTSGLDPVTSTIIMNMIKELGGRDPNVALMIATTNVEIAVRFADRIILIHEGAVVADGPWRRILLEGNDWVRNFLGVRFIGLDLEYAKELDLPQEFINTHWNVS